MRDDCSIYLFGASYFPLRLDLCIPLTAFGGRAPERGFSLLQLLFFFACCRLSSIRRRERFAPMRNLLPGPLGQTKVPAQTDPARSPKPCYDLVRQKKEFRQ